MVQEPEPEFVVARSLPPWVIAAGGLETPPAESDRRMTEGITEQNRPTNVEIGFRHRGDASLPIIFIDIDETASDDRNFRIGIKRRNEVRNSIRPGDIVGIEANDDISAGVAYSSICSLHRPKIYHVREDADAGVTGCLSSEDITLSRAVVHQNQLEILKCLPADAFNRRIKKPQILISGRDHRYAGICKGAHDIAKPEDLPSFRPLLLC